MMPYFWEHDLNIVLDYAVRDQIFKLDSPNYAVYVSNYALPLCTNTQTLNSMHMLVFRELGINEIIRLR
jgi:hypothetical protein